jgi:pimeloyl-ACP methyl ester carboxylesterase
LWQPVVDELADLVDATVAPLTGGSIAAMADEVLDGAPDGLYVAGISMGGYVALDVALRGDDRLAGVVLINTAARAASPEQRERGKAMLRDTEGGHFDTVVEKLSTGVSGGKPDIARIVAAMAHDGGSEVFVRHQTAVLARRDRRAELPNLRIPTLVISADEDRVIPPSLNNEIVRLVPDARLELVPAAGHLSTVEQPSEVAQFIRAWLRDRNGDHLEERAEAAAR